MTSLTPKNLPYEQAEAHIKAMAEAIVQDAEAYGVILTITNEPRVPLAMGNHEMVVEVRRARELAKPAIIGSWE